MNQIDRHENADDADRITAISSGDSTSGYCAWRRFLATAIATIYHMSLFVIWACPIGVFLIQAGKQSIFATAWVSGLVLLGYVSGFLLPSGYFKLCGFEKSGYVYRRLGVRRIRFLGSYGDGLERLLQWIYPPWRNPHADMLPEQWIGRTKFNERLHWALLLCSLPASVWAIHLGNPIFGCVLLVANVPYNLYPIMLQRYTRAQLLRIQEIRGKRRK